MHNSKLTDVVATNTYSLSYPTHHNFAVNLAFFHILRSYTSFLTVIIDHSTNVEWSKTYLLGLPVLNQPQARVDYVQIGLTYDITQTLTHVGLFLANE